MDSTVDNGLPHTIPYYLADKIKAGIINWHYPPGSGLREVELSAEFGASRGPVREALRILELHGLVAHSPRRGFRVKQWTADDLRQLYRLRAELEGEVINALRGKDVEALADTLDSANNEMQSCVSKGDIDGYFSANIAYHNSIIEHADSPVLSTIMNLVNAMSLPARYQLLKLEFSSRPSYDYHSQISRAIRDGNFKLACRLTKEHITTNLSHVVDSYERALERR